MKTRNIFFFDKSIEYIKSAKGCNPWYTGSIQGGLGGERKERKEIYKANDPRGKPACSPSIKST